MCPPLLPGSAFLHRCAAAPPGGMRAALRPRPRTDTVKAPRGNVAAWAHHMGVPSLALAWDREASEQEGTQGHSSLGQEMTSEIPLEIGIQISALILEILLSGFPRPLFPLSG